jgi:hypothetical protein
MLAPFARPAREKRKRRATLSNAHRCTLGAATQAAGRTTILVSSAFTAAITWGTALKRPVTRPPPLEGHRRNKQLKASLRQPLLTGQRLASGSASSGMHARVRTCTAQKGADCSKSSAVWGSEPRVRGALPLRTYLPPLPLLLCHPAIAGVAPCHNFPATTRRPGGGAGAAVCLTQGP